MKVFLDANILFSAALPGSKFREMIRTLLRHSACVTNRHAREEAERNLQIKHPDCAGELRDLLTRIPIHEGLAELAAVEIRDKDKPILAGAINAGCSHLVTGDKRDFGHLFDRTVQDVRIVTPRPTNWSRLVWPNHRIDRRAHEFSSRSHECGTDSTSAQATGRFSAQAPDGAGHPGLH